MERIWPFQRGPSGLLSGAEPFTLGNGSAGCLLVHGFTSTPYDVHACGEYLAAQGIAVEGILLAGHGTCPEDLAETRLTNWLQSIRDGYARLAQRCDRVFGLGISLSGNFLLTLAPLLPFTGLILIGTPLKFRHERAYRAAYRVLRALGKQYQKKWYLEHLDASIRSQRPTYDRFPLACVQDCMTAIAWSKENLPRIRCPILILQSTTDHAVDERTITEFRTRLASTDITVHWFPNRYHVLVIDRGAEPVFHTIAHFIQTRATESIPQRDVPLPFVQPVGSLAS
ncbi:MAG: carboxylesterase [Parcubacteria group bacterium Gr01-1014_38]|nr:MAG: carboxylesterase [Parcubacteria group bacterium Gr01-1014_38]